MSNQPTYRFRRTLFDRERTFTLADDGLSWTDSRAEGRMAFSDIREIRVYSVVGSRYSPASWRCFVHPAQGGKIHLTSLHFAGLGDFEDRQPAMLAFCHELVARAAHRNPSIVFMRGLPRPLWFLSLFFLIVLAAGVAFGFVLVALMLADPGISPLTVLIFAGGLAGFALMAFFLWQWLKRSWPQPFDPLTSDPFAA